MSKQFDVTEFESANLNLQLIETIGSGQWKTQLFLNPKDNRYYAKGPFARWDSVCYILLEKVLTSSDADLWLQEMKKRS